ncbi:outer membrane beta-barrel protein [Flagellimonas sp.]|uniref:outer membrane beta-barrel protein n=1 Tax=Flagellimonas sp. TaxID=2058762 RepID=UPI003B52DF5C
MGKKNLEQLFKEKLGDFQELPDDAVWKSIEASLDKKKQKKRVVPIWWRLGGAAAVMAILLYVINPFGDSDNNEPIIISETENTEILDEQNNASDKIEQSTISEEDGLVDTQENNTLESNQNDVVETSEGKSNSVSSNPSQFVSGQEVAESPLTGNQNPTQADPLRKDAPKTHEYADVAATESSEKRNAVGQEVQNKERKDVLDLAPQPEKEAVATNNPNQQQSKTNLLENATQEEDAIVQNQVEETKNEGQSIFDAIAEQEEDVVAQNSGSKWSVGPSIAPVYFSAAGEGSPVHSSFASNSKSGNVDLSYGVFVAYEVGKKLKVRTGVHRVNFGYDTNDVVFSSSLDGSSVNLIDNIDYARQSENIVVESRDKGALSLDKEEVNFSSSAVLDGKMIQNLGYLEIPLELNYSLIDKKFGVDLIGGVSSLFLVDNSVLLESEGLVTEVGEANNANSMNFSTNVGLGFNYKFSPKVQLNLEPVFKYQLNTFSDTSGSFRPFSVGVYSGFSFKF